MIYARQVSPEYQESPMCYIDDIYENVIFAGNRDFKGRTTYEYDKIVANIDCLSDLSDIGTRYSYYDNITDLVNSNFPKNSGNYSPRQIGKWRKLIERYNVCSSDEERDIICEALTLMTGKQYDYHCIRGCCQGDWQYIYYPIDDYNDKMLDIIEKDYFNEGSEWIIHDEDEEPESPEDINGTGMYCFEWGEDDIKQEIANAFNCSRDEVVLYKFTGYSRVPNYEIA